MKISSLRTIIVLVLLFATSCSSDSGQLSGTVKTMAPVASLQSPDYVLSPGDTINVAFTYTPERSQNQIIRPDGDISLPVINDIQAAGLTTDGLRTALIQRYTTVGDLKNPDITVTVQAFGGNRIYVGGEVVQPGPVALVGPTSVLQAVLMAQGFKDSARRGDVILIRQGAGGVVSWQRINLKSPRKGGAAATLVQARDIIYVPKSEIAHMDTFVDLYIRQMLPIAPSLQIPAQ